MLSQRSHAKVVLFHLLSPRCRFCISQPESTAQLVQAAFFCSGLCFSPCDSQWCSGLFQACVLRSWQFIQLRRHGLSFFTIPNISYLLVNAARSPFPPLWRDRITLSTKYLGLCHDGVHAWIRVGWLILGATGDGLIKNIHLHLSFHKYIQTWLISGTNPTCSQ